MLSEKNKLIAASFGWGTAAGAILLALIGFNALGWYSSSAAKQLASDTADAQVVKVMTPLCEASFRRGATPAQWADFKAKDTYSRGDIVKAVVKDLGADSLDNYALMSNCADELSKPPAKSAMK